MADISNSFPSSNVSTIIRGIDRQDLTAWKEQGSKDTFQRAKEMVQRILKDHKPEPLPADVEKELDGVTRKMMKKHGISNLPLGPS